MRARAWGLLLASLAGSAAAQSLSSVEVVRASFDDPAQVRALAAYHDHMIVSLAKRVVVLEADASDRERLVALGFRLETDVEATRALQQPVVSPAHQLKGISGFPCYRTVAETGAWLAQLQASHPGLVDVVDIGDSWEKATGFAGGGEDLKVLRLTNEALGGDKPRVFVMSSIHAREYTPAETVARTAQWFVDGYGVDADATWILDHHELHLLVQSNPDGRKRAESQSGGSGNSAQRKNMNRDYCGTGRLGIDLNRNYPFEWGLWNGSSGSACDDTFRGPSPASEPETQAVTAYVRSIFPDVRGPGANDAAPADTTGLFFDMHSYSSLVLWPWGGTSARAPNGPAMETLGRRFAWFNSYTPEQSVGLYPTDGTTDDFAYGELGVPAYTFEQGTSFFQACATFENTVFPGNLKALVYAARVARAPYTLPAGPESRDVRATPDLAFPGETVTVLATLDDSRFSTIDSGTQPPAVIQPVHAIASGSAYFDQPPWLPGAAPIAMSPGDGAFNAPLEAASAAIDTTGIAPGRYTAFVQGRDASGTAGPVAAAFVQVADPATTGTLAGIVRSATSGTPIGGARVSAGGLASTSVAGTGAYERRLPAGTYAVDARADGFEPETAPGVNLAGGQTLARDFALFPYCRLLAEDAESGGAGWTTQVISGSATFRFAITPGATAQTGSRAWTESPAGNYGDGLNTALISPLFNLAGYTSPRLSFDSWCDTEATFDFGIVETRSGPVSPWVEAFRCDGDPALRRISIDLPGLAGQSQAQIRFRLTTDGSVVDNGWFVDNIVVEAGGPTCRATFVPAALGAPDLGSLTDSGTSTSDNITSAATPTFFGSCVSDDVVALHVDGATTAAQVLCTSGTYQLGVPLAEGKRAVAVVARRGLLEGAPSPALTVVVDRTGPAAPTITGFTGTGPITISGTTTEGAGAVVVREGPGAVCGAVPAATAPHGWSCTASLLPGLHQLFAGQTDVAGNIGVPSDGFPVPLAPAAPGAPDLLAASDTGESAVDDLTNATMLEFTGSCVNGDIVHLRVNGSDAGSSTSCVDGTYRIAAFLVEGDALAVTTVAEYAGLISPASAALGVTVDRTGPAAPVVTGPAASTVIDVEVTGSAAEGAGRVDVYRGALLACSSPPAAGGEHPWSCVAGLGDGSNELSARQVDRAGNTGASSAPFAAQVTLADGMFSDSFED